MIIGHELDHYINVVLKISVYYLLYLVIRKYETGKYIHNIDTPGRRNLN